MLLNAIIRPLLFYLVTFSRLGTNGAVEVTNHDWLKTFPWEKLRNKQLDAMKIYKTNEREYKKLISTTKTGLPVYEESKNYGESSSDKEFILEKSFQLGEDAIQSKATDCISLLISAILGDF